MVNLLGIGTAVPLRAISQSHAAEHALMLSPSTKKEARFASLLYQHSGIKARGSVLLQGKKNIFIPFFLPAEKRTDRGPGTAERMKEFVQKAPVLALQAAKQAIRDGRVKPGEIRHLITLSCTGFSAPGFDIELIETLDLPRDLTRTHIGFMGCHGAINGFRIARALALTHPEDLILLCSVEIASIHYAYGWQPDRVVANSLFADGAAAAVISSRELKASWKISATGSNIFSDSKNAMSWKIGNHGFEMGLSAQVPELIARNLKPWLQNWLSHQGLAMKDVKSWAVHPGGPKILDAVETSLALPADALSASRQILAKHGNMSSATIFFILEEFRRLRAPLPCMALAFGPGLTAEAALFLEH